MRIRILKRFRIGSVSDPKVMLPGATVDCDREDLIPKWVEMGWVEVVE